jgi:Spy/CpxP family protein refolding chaperone
MRAIAVAALVFPLLFAACSSSDYDDPRSYPRGRGGEGGGWGGGRDGGAMMRGRRAEGLDLLPPSDWWRDARIADAVNVTAEEAAALDKLAPEQDEIEKLERDAASALRELRTLIDGAHPTSDDITAAGQRVRDLRSTMFDRQIHLLAAERTILTQDQWERLQDALQSERTERGRGRDRGGYPGGRGGFPGRGGRRPGGWPG